MGYHGTSASVNIDGNGHGQLGTGKAIKNVAMTLGTGMITPGDPALSEMIIVCDVPFAARHIPAARVMGIVVVNGRMSAVGATELISVTLTPWLPHG